MEIISYLEEKWKFKNTPFLVVGNNKYYFEQLKINYQKINLDFNVKGKTVAVVGDFNLEIISLLFFLLENKAIIVPLTDDTRYMHEKLFNLVSADYVIEKELKTIKLKEMPKNVLVEGLIKDEKPGIILFTSGSTGEPKAILHDATNFLIKYYEPRPCLNTAAFLLFDHIGGINTLLHTLFNLGTLVILNNRDPHSVINICVKEEVELLPTSPTFLRMLLFSGILINEKMPKLKLVTYGTEKMDQGTLVELGKLLPHVDFKQTYGMSEVGILKIKSKSRDSLFIKIGGDGVATKIVDEILYIKSKRMMLGYLNVSTSFEEGWFNTRDKVLVDGDYIKIQGRETDVINVAGIKYSLYDIEEKILEHSEVVNAKVVSRPNPITGHHIEAIVEKTKDSNLDEKKLKDFLKRKLERHAIPQRIIFSNIEINYRFKKN